MAYHLNFHQTFKPEAIHIGNLLTIDHGKFSKDYLSQKFCIPTGKTSGKVEVNLLYAQAAGLLKFKKNDNDFTIQRTPIGKIINEEDSFLEAYCTKIYLHYMFCTLKSDLLLWEILFKSFHRGINEFSRNEFNDYLNKKKSIKTKIKLAPLFGTYTGEKPIIDINVLNKKEKNVYSFGKVQILESLVDWYGYLLIDFVQRLNPNRIDFKLDEILKNGYSSIFSWNQDDIRHLLNLLYNKKIIDVNTQFSNWHITLVKNFDDLKLEFN